MRWREECWDRGASRDGIFVLEVAIILDNWHDRTISHREAQREILAAHDAWVLHGKVR